MEITELLEALMVLCFGVSWPVSIMKSYKSRTAKGKSLVFLLFIGFGYVVGIIWKILEYRETGVFKYPSYFYILNLTMISIDIGLYFRNRLLDKKADIDKQN